jgi:hypothetical protein
MWEFEGDIGESQPGGIGGSWRIGCMGGRGAGRGEVRRLSSVGNTHESMRSETETIACLCLDLILSFEVPSALLTE